MEKLVIPNKEVRELAGQTTYVFPKYATQLMNLANQNSQATRPKIVGQLSELIQLFDGTSIEEWEAWYLKQHPDSIDQASNRIFDMLTQLKQSLNSIDKDIVRKWVEELVVIKTYTGLKFQEAILKKIAEEIRTNYRLASPEDESKGIDGYIGNKPVSIKPITYKNMTALSEIIAVSIIYYEKKKNGIIVEFDKNYLL